MKSVWLFLAVIVLAACAPLTSFKLIKDYNSRVLDRPTLKECPLLWYGVFSDHVEEVYGEPCNVIIRKEKIIK